MICDINEINQKINSAIFEYQMLKDKSSVVLGVSGGSDSMTLLKFFIEHSNVYSLKNIIVAHINHCLRGSESDRDESFVRNYCREYNVCFELLRVDVAAKAKKLGCSVEEAARNIRYEYFFYLAQKYDAVVATAHTLSDSIETMLINLTRGTGSAGLCGIPPKRDTIIRPLIYLKKTDTEFYCFKHNISYVTDSSNLENIYTRNKVRLDVVPVLKQINPEFENAVGRTLSLLREDEQYLSDMAKNLLNESCIAFGKYDLKNISKQPFSILSRCIRSAISQFNKLNVNSLHIKLILNLIKAKTGAVMLPNNLKVSVRNNVLFLEKEKSLTHVVPDFQFNFKSGEILTDFSGEFIVKVLNKSDFDQFLKINNLLFFYALDYDTINENTLFRNRRSGDKFSMVDRHITKTVKKLFNELKIPLENRSKLLMLANENQVLWIDNIGVSESAKIKPSTKKIVLIYSKEK